MARTRHRMRPIVKAPCRGGTQQKRNQHLGNVRVAHTASYPNYSSETRLAAVFPLLLARLLHHAKEAPREFSNAVLLVQADGLMRD